MAELDWDRNWAVLGENWIVNQRFTSFFLIIMFRFVFLLFLFKTHLDRFLIFNSVLIFFYLVKINNLIFLI